MPLPSTLTPIATTTLGSGITTATLSSISSAYTDLVMVITRGGDEGSLRMYFNSDTGTNYSTTIIAGTGSAANSVRQSTQNAILINGVYGATNANTNTIVQLQNYSNTTTNKTVLSRGTIPDDETVACVGLWRSTAAINSISITAINGTGLWLSGSTITLYGIKAA
jgi:hypothetical protein